MKKHTVKAMLNALERRPVVMRPPETLRATVRGIEGKRGVTLAPRKAILKEVE